MTCGVLFAGWRCMQAMTDCRTVLPMLLFRQHRFWLVDVVTEVAFTDIEVID